MNAASNASLGRQTGIPGTPNASRDSLRELLLGMGGSSMRKSYYPELRSKLDDLELFRELVERSSDAILLFSLPQDRLLFANFAAREAFALGEREAKDLGIKEILSSAPEAGYPECLGSAEDAPAPGSGCPTFIQEGSGRDGGRRFEVVVNEVAIAGNRYAIAVARDLTDRLLMEERIERDLREKETMLREIHHRVKNNFQLMKSLLSLEAASISDERARIPLLEAENRIMSMASAHERIYESPDLSNIDAAAYFGDIVTTVRISFQDLYPGTKVEFSGESLYLPLEVALPCGLIVNELLSNCLKHAFPELRPGQSCDMSAPEHVSISIGKLEEPEGWGFISVRDNGVGFDTSILDEEIRSVGLVLTQSLTAQIGGSISWKVEAGTEAILRFPLSVG
jgi:two-component system, sensor histidine kinase PdtaS